MPAASRAFAMAMIAAAVGSLAAISLTTKGAPPHWDPWLVISLILLGACAKPFQIALPYAPSQKLDTSLCIHLMTIFLLAHPLSAAVVAAGESVGQVILIALRQRRSWGAAFNVAQWTLAALAAALVAGAALPGLITMPGAALAMCAVTSAAVAVMAAFSKRTSPLGEWRRGRRATAVQSAVLTLVAICAVQAMHHPRVVLLLIVVPLGGVFLWMRAGQRLQEQQRALERAHAQAQAAERDRLRALGEMAAGIAHDLNNALAPVVGFTELLLLRSRQPERFDVAAARPYLELIHTGAEDAAKVVARLREFYRRRAESRTVESVSLPKVAEQVIALTEPKWRNEARSAGRTISVVNECAPVAPVAADAAELREALTNLILNAVDALPTGGTITLRTGRDTSGESAYVEVTDDGMGMTEDVRKHIREPFFTTKGERGTGLGLTMVQGIVAACNGSMDVRFAPGAGTTVRLTLPLAPAAAGAEPDAARPAGPPRGWQILVVDDEAVVRSVMLAYLNSDGHIVDESENGDDALVRLRQAAYDVVITDRSMPGMSGDQLAARVAQVAPGTPVILATGFGALMDAAGELPRGVDFILAKPVTFATLRAALLAVQPAVDAKRCQTAQRSAA